MGGTGPLLEPGPVDRRGAPRLVASGDEISLDRRRVFSGYVRVNEHGERVPPTAAIPKRFRLGLMLVIRFGSADLANVRFAISPLTELFRSLRALQDPSSGALHLPWISETRERVSDLPLEVLFALQPERVYSPDFVNPPPRTPLAELEDGLSEMLATPPERVVAEIRFAYETKPMPPVLQPFIADPEAALPELADLLRAYWERALAPHWERLRTLLEGDVLYRARQLADGGATALFADVHPEARFQDDELRIEKPFEDAVTLDGRGLLFVPSAFAWPQLVAITVPPWQPTLIYPARGVATLWEPARPGAPGALAALLGRRRASVLAALDSPRSTSELARLLGLSAASVSQHLAVLRNAGLVNGHRVGRVVLYLRSAAGDALAGASPQRETAFAPPDQSRPPVPTR